MAYDYWFFLEHGLGLGEFCPVEFDRLGNVECVVTGMTIMTSLAEMKGRVKKIWKVDSLTEPKEVVQVWPQPKEEHADHSGNTERVEEPPYLEMEETP